MVLLRLQPYRQNSIQKRVSPKLSKHYFGPFPIRHRIGPVAYEMLLPPTSKINPVFHVSQLRAYHGKDPTLHFTPIPSDLLLKPATSKISDAADTLPQDNVASNQTQVQASLSKVKKNNVSDLSLNTDDFYPIHTTSPPLIFSQNSDNHPTPLDLITLA